MQNCFIIGHPVEHSLSPKIHNFWYHELGLHEGFKYSFKEVKSGELANFLDEFRDMGYLGTSVTAPHKVDIIKHLDWIDPVAIEIGAVNTIVNNQGKIFGYNTDWLGVLLPILNIFGETVPSIRSPEVFNNILLGQKVAIIGAGGAARAAIYAFKLAGSEVTIYNRTKEKGEALTEELKVNFRSINELYEVKKANIIIQSTSVGLNDENAEIIAPEFLKSDQIILDMVYKPLETKLIRDGQKTGAKTIFGTEMLVYQAAEQFRLFTGQEVSKKLVNEVLVSI